MSDAGSDVRSAQGGQDGQEEQASNAPAPVKKAERAAPVLPSLAPLGGGLASLEGKLVADDGLVDC